MSPGGREVPVIACVGSKASFDGRMGVGVTVVEDQMNRQPTRRRRVRSVLENRGNSWWRWRGMQPPSTSPLNTIEKGGVSTLNFGIEIRTGCSCPVCNQAEASGLCLLLQDCQPNSPRSGALRLKLNFSQGESSLELKSREVLFFCLLNALAETGHSPILIRLAA